MCRDDATGGQERDLLERAGAVLAMGQDREHLSGCGRSPPLSNAGVLGVGWAAVAPRRSSTTLADAASPTDGPE